jgi:hypothetical protein
MRYGGGAYRPGGIGGPGGIGRPGGIGGPGGVGGPGGIGGPGANWNRFNAGYAARYPAGYNTFAYGGRYYYWYPSLPVGAVAVPYGPVVGYAANGVYYMPYFFNGQVVYIAVPPP